MLRDVFFAILLRQNVARPLSATAVKRGKRVNRRRKKQNEMRSSSSCVLLIFAGPAAVAGQASSVARPGRPSQPQEGKGTGGCRLDGLDVASGTYTLQEAGSCRLRPDEAAPYTNLHERDSDGDSSKCTPRVRRLPGSKRPVRRTYSETYSERYRDRRRGGDMNILC